jgi:hypothetical protein
MPGYNTLPQATLVFTQMPSRLITASSPTGAPSKLSDAMGCVPLSGTVAVETSDGDTLTVWLYSATSKTWRLLTVSGSLQAKTYPSGGGLDWFLAPPGALVYIQATTGSLNLWTDLDAV